ncbi:Trm112 family protein [Henriciella aquimarina]|uniref:Trm112 family protein n=1 Tax=Henriciella aquimarina TaxID=545261 RepID=UPI000A032316|nr:Trm112 family protein [Henriciella aquimarina]
MTDTDTSPTDPDTGGKTDPRLLELLICPVTRTPLSYDRERQELVSKKAKLAYPIRDGLPIMLESEARSLDGA